MFSSVNKCLLLLPINKEDTINYSPLSPLIIQDEIEHPAISAAIHPPVYKIVSPVTGYHYVCEALTQEELQYFQQQGNNATLFIHGYDVIDGVYPNTDIVITPQGTITTQGASWYFNRTFSDINSRLKQQTASSNLIENLKRYYQNNDQSFDQILNGTGAHNWLLHMEYNFNCAAARQYAFPWKDSAQHYQRLIAIHWPGAIGDIEIIKTLSFGGAELNALASAMALQTIVHQLHASGIRVNLVAHSLGCLVAIKLMDLIGREELQVFDQVILWQAAISDRALSPQIDINMETRLNPPSSDLLTTATHLLNNVVDALAGTVAGLMDAGLGIYGNYLRTEAALINQSSSESIWSEDPFTYFPYAHQSARAINVLYSQYDEVLAFMYRAQDEAFNFSVPGYIHRAMGLVGPDAATLNILGNKVCAVNQQAWLQGHSMMKIPSLPLFQNIYCEKVINAQHGIRQFGRWPL